MCLGYKKGSRNRNWKGFLRSRKWLELGTGTGKGKREGPGKGRGMDKGLGIGPDIRSYPGSNQRQFLRSHFISQESLIKNWIKDWINSQPCNDKGRHRVDQGSM